MVRRLARLRVFGKLDRDQVVDQADEARPAARFQARDQSALFEMVVRDQQIDGAAGLSRSMPNSRRSLPASSARRARRAIRRTRRSCSRGSSGPRQAAPISRTKSSAIRRGSSASLPSGVSAAKTPASRSRSGARHRRARPGRCRSAFRGRRATAGATDRGRSRRRVLDQGRSGSVRTPRARRRFGRITSPRSSRRSR